MRTDRLSGPLLDYWVARAEGYEIRAIAGIAGELDHILVQGEVFGGWKYSPSTDWAQAGVIIDREAIGFIPLSDAEWLAEEHITAHRGRGPTHLIAAMRAYVASKFGDEVSDLPIELEAA
jgi:hypothetical protein